MIKIEVVFATPELQVLVPVEVAVGSTLLEAIASSGIEARFPDEAIDQYKKGVWGEIKPDSYEVESGDRIEIYRPLVTDPKEARRKRAMR